MEKYQPDVSWPWPALVDLARARGEALSGDPRLGAIPTVGPYLLPQAERRARPGFSPSRRPCMGGRPGRTELTGDQPAAGSTRFMPPVAGSMVT